MTVFVENSRTKNAAWPPRTSIGAAYWPFSSCSIYAASGTSPTASSNHAVSIDTQRPECVRSSSSTIAGSPSMTVVSTFIVWLPAEVRTSLGGSGGSAVSLGALADTADSTTRRYSPSSGGAYVSPTTGSSVSTSELGSSPIGAAGSATAAIRSTAASPSGLYARFGIDTPLTAPRNCGAISWADCASCARSHA
ncbi:hypothetical protein C461_04737 [Halorubrum aidingense JCM 13560]|uniref:Uncharacterized protein n=1 Tax=Halorubrum aidingense JCM 13560 TaxID=1230454 RepID=M0PG73_9EURY|nr:hypothetical protein C461_04737 [Halorubrum aidingense JCM 13560]